MRLRTICLTDDDDIDLIAQRMRATLVEVEGETAGGGMYTMAWLRDRVRWHLGRQDAEVVAADPGDGAMIGHSIYRVEAAVASTATDPFGLISTTYVLPESRRLGVAQLLLEQAERWFVNKGLRTSCTWTSATNAPLIALYQRNGYAEAERGANALTHTMMVRLEKTVAA